MMKKHYLGTLLTTSALILTVGCASKTTIQTDEPVVMKPAAPVAPAPALKKVVEKKVVSLPPLNDVTVLFAFDSAEIQPSEVDILDTHARYLQQHTDQRLVLEGHTDERGTEQYNDSLGQQRAAAIEAALLAKGINENQLRIVSFGERQPKIAGQTEASWRSNRRVTFAYELSDEQLAAVKASGANTFVLGE